jgi:sulfur carrier protein ThiS
VKVLLRNPRRELEVDLSAARSVGALLDHLGLGREGHLVIRNGTLVPGDAALATDDEVEIRPVISGG